MAIECVTTRQRRVDDMRRLFELAADSMTTFKRDLSKRESRIGREHVPFAARRERKRRGNAAVDGNTRPSVDRNRRGTAPASVDTLSLPVEGERRRRTRENTRINECNLKGRHVGMMRVDFECRLVVRMTRELHQLRALLFDDCTILQTRCLSR
jgi:hypothetical protein